MILFSGIAYLYFSSWYFLQKKMKNNLEIVINKRMLNLLKSSPYILHNCPDELSATNAFLKKCVMWESEARICYSFSA